MKKIVPILFLALLSCKSAKEDFRFEKIMYHSGPCFGFCPSYHMQIDNNKTVLLKGDSTYNKRRGGGDDSRAGYFIGKVADTSYQKLVAELSKIGLDTLKFRGPNCCDAAMKTIIVYYNGKRRYLHAMFPPDHAHGLISTLNGIYSRNKFEPTQQRFEIEHDSLPQKPKR